ncbi:MAG: hypothetical protein M0Z85_01305 [Gammaproteobacteria bacterium]|nr:hypothetical protein [Gammaproteobacteria bacterium]
MGDADELTKVFLADVERIADDFIECFGLAFTKDVPSLSCSLYRWLEFVHLRYVEPIPRSIHFSRGFWRRVPGSERLAVDHFVHHVMQGEDINPYQGKGLSRHDISGRKQATRTDLLLADFGIHHFHLTDKVIPLGRAYSQRSNWMLFAVVRKNALLCVDVQRHPRGEGFAQKGVLEIAIKNWPQAFAQYEAKGVTGGDWSPAEIDHMRKHGGNMLHKIGSRVYGCLGGGLTSAGTPLLVHKISDCIQREIEDLARQFVDPQGAPAKLRRDDGILNPNFHVVLTPEGAAVHEESVRTGWPLSGWPGIVLLAPQWAIARLAASAQ